MNINLIAMVPLFFIMLYLVCRGLLLRMDVRIEERRWREGRFKKQTLQPKNASQGIYWHNGDIWERVGEE